MSNITEKSFILVQEDTNQFVIGDHLEELLRKEMRPILWFRIGMACVVPVEVLKNALEYIDMLCVLMKIPELRNAEIDWKQAFPFPDSRAAAILAGLEH